MPVTPKLSSGDAVSPTAVPAVTATASESIDASTIDDSKTAVRALALGLFAASTYSVANLALRGLSKSDGGAGWDMWVAGVKALPTFAAAVVLLWIRRQRGQSSFVAWSFVWPIAVAALFNQLGGNFAFQMSLRAIGLAISVPICFASIICSGAIVGRTVLGDQISVRTAISIGLMVASIVFLSVAAESRSDTDARTGTAEILPVVTGDALVVTGADESDQAGPKQSPMGVPTGVALSVLSGLCYGVTGVFIRKAVTSQMPVAATLFLFSAVGFLVLCPLSLFFLPVQTIAESSRREWFMIAVAGTFNAIGFFAITHAMRHLTISRANVINASQNAMCAVGAVLVFQESLSPIGLLGIGMAIAGLLALDRK